MKKLEKQTLASNKLRLFSIFIAVFLIPMLLMCIMNLWAVHNDTINTASQFTGQLLQQNSTTIDNVLRLIDGSFSQLFMNGDVLDFFQATSLPSTFDEYKGIADIFSEMRSVLDRGNGYLGFAESKWVGGKYFLQFFNSPQFWPLLRNTMFQRASGRSLKTPTKPLSTKRLLTMCSASGRM